MKRSLIALLLSVSLLVPGCSADDAIFIDGVSGVNWTGPQGLPGSNGTIGSNGTNGLNGTNGTNGLNGTNGTNGVNGTVITFSNNASQFYDGTGNWSTPAGSSNHTHDASNITGGSSNNTVLKWLNSVATWASVTFSDITTWLGYTPADNATRAQANGLATLNSSTLVPSSQLASGTANSTTYLRGDGSWAAVAASAVWGAITGAITDQIDLIAKFGEYILATIGTAKGDLLGWTGSNATARIPIGQPGEMLTVVSANNTGVGWTMPIRNFRRQWAIQPNDGLITIVQDGFATAPSAQGTAVNLTDDATGYYITYNSSAANTSTAGWMSSSFNMTQRRHAPIQAHVLLTPKAGNMTSIVIWCGMTAAHMTGDDPATDFMGFSYSTSRDGTANWRFVTNNGSATTITDTGVAITASTRYVLTIDASNVTSVSFYINSIFVGTSDTNLPALTTKLGYCFHVENKVAQARNIHIGRIHMEHN